MLTTVFLASGVETPLWLPPVAGFVLSYFCSMAGISGAVLLLPFQMSVLGFTSPAVGPTNMVFNIVGIPSGVYRYLRERRLVAHLAWVVIAGTVPGVIFGEVMRAAWLPDPKHFKIFVGFVLFGLGLRHLTELRKSRRQAKSNAGKASKKSVEWSVKALEFNHRWLAYEFQGQTYRCRTLGIVSLSFVVGLVGGVYGIGGGAILAPVFVSVYGLPVHTVAGATLMGTWITSIVGVVFAALIAPYWHVTGMAIAPDWLLGTMFGVGGLCGMYLGARTQRYVSAFALKLLIGVVLFAAALNYLIRVPLGL